MSRGHDDGRAGTSRVLWGRIAVAVLALLLAFALGRCSAEGGVEQARYDEAQARITELEQANRDLAEREIAAAAGGFATTPPPDAPEEEPAPAEEPAEPAPQEPAPEEQPAESPPPDPAPAPGEDPAPAATPYTVQQGDTLESIAERVYGDRSRSVLIAEANDVDAGNLQIGQVLQIPPAPPPPG